MNSVVRNRSEVRIFSPRNEPTPGRVAGRLFQTNPHRRGQQRFLRCIGSSELSGNLSLAHDVDSMAETKNFGQLRGDNQNAATLRREVDYELIDFGFGPHIDTAR